MRGAERKTVELKFKDMQAEQGGGAVPAAGVGVRGAPTVWGGRRHSPLELSARAEDSA